MLHVLLLVLLFPLLVLFWDSMLAPDAGPVYPDATDVTVTSGESTSLTVQGVSMSATDSLVVIKGSPGRARAVECVAPNFFAVQIELLRGGADESVPVFVQGIAAGEREYLKTGFKNINQSGSQADTMDFSIAFTGHYALCWRGIVDGQHSFGLVRSLVVVGMSCRLCPHYLPPPLIYRLVPISIVLVLLRFQL